MIEKKPEPGRYNPNFDAIEKNSPKARFIGKAKDPYEALMLKRNNSEPLETIIESIDNVLITNIEKRFFKNQNQDATEGEAGMSKLEYARREHYVNQKYNFDNYLPRSDIYYNPNKTNILCYVEPESLVTKYI